MNYREKRLATFVGGGLAVLAAWQIVKWTAVDPIQSLHKKIEAASARQTKLKIEAAAVGRVTGDWQERTARTLHARRDDARRIFRQEIDRLAQEHGLIEAVRLSDGMPQQVNSEGFVALPVAVRCSGNLKSVLNFLVAFYKLPYLARITNVTLTAEEAGPARGRGREKEPQPEPRLNVSINASALVLPPLAGVKDERHGEYAEVTDVKRLSREEPEYARLFERNIFAKWTPKPVVVETPVRRTEDPKTPSGPTDRPIRVRDDPRRDADKYKIVSSESLHGEAFVTVQDERKRDQAPTEYRMAADIEHEGTVVLIQPRGMVVRAQEDTDGVSQTKYYFYELGKTFKDRVEVSRESHPDLAAELNLASAQ